jgi:hypothetical protein
MVDFDTTRDEFVVVAEFKPFMLRCSFRRARRLVSFIEDFVAHNKGRQDCNASDRRTHRISSELLEFVLRFTRQYEPVYGQALESQGFEPT